MDTRDKIIADPRLARGSAAVTGYFDVLRPWHIGELNRAKDGGGRVTAIVLPLGNGLLSQRARAELAASLRVVDYVIIAADGPLDALFEEMAPGEVIRLEKADLQQRSELIEHVHKRQIG